MQYVQGDLMFIPIEEKHEDFSEQLEPVDGKYIIAEGEKTGHTHVVEASHATWYDSITAEWAKQTGQTNRGRGILVIDVDDTPIMHDEHPPLPLAAGTYRVVRQEEVPLREAVAEEPKTRAVWD